MTAPLHVEILLDVHDTRSRASDFAPIHKPTHFEVSHVLHR